VNGGGGRGCKSRDPGHLFTLCKKFALCDWRRQQGQEQGQEQGEQGEQRGARI